MTDRKPSDDDLWRAMREGDEAAFAALYRHWQSPIFRFALQMSGSRAIAEEVTQDVFLALLKEASGYRPSRGSLGGYLYGIARHLVLRALEGERVPGPVTGEDEREKLAETLRAPGADPHDEMVRNQRVERLWNAVLGLPVHYREALVLCELHEIDYAEAAALLGCSIGTVRSRLHRARAMLTERLRSAALQAARIVRSIEPDGCAI